MDITIIVNGFYGNRTVTEIDDADFDRFMLGYIDESISIPNHKKIDRTVVNVPNTKNSVFVYNKYMEADKNGGKPTLIIGDIVLHSRVIACGIDENGNFISVNPDDYEEIFKYLAE